MGEITGRQVLIFTVGAFGVIIAVNGVMAWKAISTFPGLEVKNSYIASQSFDARRAGQERLGWTMAQDYSAETGRLSLRFADAEGKPAPVGNLEVLVGRTTQAVDDRRPVFADLGGVWEASLPLERGKWMVRVTAQAPDGTPFEQRFDLFVQD
jgi:nitrogen fixation protein FixH